MKSLIVPAVSPKTPSKRKNPGLALAGTVALVLSAHSAQATTYDWSGNTSASMSGVPANWGGTTPGGGDTARWNLGSYTNSPSANVNMVIGQLLFDAGNTSSLTFGGGTAILTLNGITAGNSTVGIQLNNGSGAVNTSLTKFSLGGSQTWLNNSANTFTVGGTITNTGNTTPRTLTLDGTGSTILNGNISNGGTIGTTTITKLGNGTLTLGGTNTFTGGLNVQEGTVQLSLQTAAAGAGLVTIGSSGKSAVLDLNGASRAFSSLATAGTAANQKITNTANAPATLSYTGANTSTFGGVIENGSGGNTTFVTVNGTGANLTLSGLNTYTGVTSVTNGTLKIGATNAINSGNALTTSAGGTFDLNGFDQTIGLLTNTGTITNSSATTQTLTFGTNSTSSASGSFTGAMNVIFNNSNSAVTTLTAAWSNTGNITVNNIGSNSINFNGALNNTGTITNGGSNQLVINGNISANVGLITQNGATSILQLTGTNTNVNGVTLAAGTLRLGSPTALGATASRLTIGAGTILDSTAANLVLVNNNPQTWNGNFTFTGTQNLDLGAGAVTIAAPLTLTTTANTLAVGGTISGGTIFDITKAGTGTLIYGGNTAMTANQTANFSGNLILTGNVTGGYGVTVNGPGTFSLRGATANAAASAITANAATVLTIDGSTGGAGTTRAASVTLKGTTLNVLGNSGANSVETITGNLTANVPSTFSGPGANTVTLTANGATNTRLSAGSLVRTNNGTMFFRGTNLGSNTIGSATAGTSNIEFTAAPTGANFVGGGGAAGTQTISIIPWAVGATTANGNASGFVTYDGNGIRVLSSGEVATTVSGGTVTANNVKLDAAAGTVTANGATTINSLFITNAAGATTIALAGTSALTVTSGAIYADMSLGTSSNVTSITKQIDFGAVEGVIGTSGTNNTKTLSFAGGITGSGGLTIYDTNSGQVPTVQGGVAFNAGTTYTGDTIINGSLIVSSLNALPNFAHLGRTGDVYVYGSFGVNVVNLRINGLFGSGNLENPFATNRTVIVGDNNATSTFTGAVTANLGLTKVGAGTLTLTGTNNTYNQPTNIQSGILSAVSLNSVSSGLNSTLGKPTSIANGTIGLGSATNTGQLTVVNSANETTDRVINLAGTTGGGVIDQSGTGALKFASAFTATGAGNKTLTLQGSTTGTGEIVGAIVNNSAGNMTSVTKAGSGTWTLSGTNTYTGGTNINAGTLALGGAAGSSTILADTGAVAIGGGTLDLANHNETVGAVTSTGGTIASTGGAGVLTGSGLSVTGGTTTIGSGATYAGGATTVGSGSKLVVSGSLSGTTLTNSGTLSGSGTVSNLTTIASGGRSYPSGVGSTSASVLTLDLTYNSGSNAQFGLQSGTTTHTGGVGAGTQYDQVVVTNGVAGVDLQLGAGTAASQILATGNGTSNSNVTLTLSMTGLNFLSLKAGATNSYQGLGSNTGLNNFFVLSLGTALSEGRFQFLALDTDNDGIANSTGSILYGGTGFGRFGSSPGVTNTLGNAFVGGQEFAISYIGNYAANSTIGGNDIVLTAIPEPSTMAAMLGGLGVLVALQRRRRK